MICIHCKEEGTEVVDTKECVENSNYIYRTHKCNKCGKTFGTVELPFSILEGGVKVLKGVADINHVLYFGMDYARKVKEYTDLEEPYEDDEEKTEDGEE